MPSTNHGQAGRARLIERLLYDPTFRAAFRRNPAEACREHGLHDLAAALSPGGSLNTLELRESKSSLAGVIMAFAAEGVGLGELTGLVGHGPHPPAGHPGGSLMRAAEPKPHPPALAHDAGMGDRATHGVANAVGESATSAGANDSHAVSDGVAELLANPHLSAPAAVRSELLHGDVDGRAVSVLQDIAARHAIVIGDLHAVTDPVHAQALDVVSVDGQPVGPGNVAARDLLTEIAALDPTVRPDQIGSPWPIGSPGFFSDPSQQGRLRLVFVSSADSQPVGSGGLATQAAPRLVPTGSDASNPATAAGPHIAAASDVAVPAPGPSQTASAYVNPLPADAQIGRTDMGVDVDLKPGEPIVAIGNSRVLGITPGWYRGQPYVALQLLDGPLKGRNYYVAEQIDVAVAPGEIVRRGQVIAHYAASGTGIEIGWAGPQWEQTLAKATSGYSEGERTPAGMSFHGFLQSLSRSGESPQPSASPTVSAASDATGQAPPADRALTADQASPAARPALKPVTAVFSAPHHRRRDFQRQTVQFRALSDPQPGSPPRDQLAARSMRAVADAAGDAIFVSSPMLTSGQEQFAAHLAQLTGLDPRVVSAWALAEESGGPAQIRQAASNFNWLNIGYFDSGAGRIAFDNAFKDPVSAAEQTARFLQGKWGGASASIRAILGTVGQSPQQQIEAIASSDWASSHYGDGANLRATYDELSDMQITPA